MKIKVSVTEDDIENGGSACHNCPVARALLRATGVMWKVHGDTGETRLGIEWRPYWFPGLVGEFVRSYDKCFDVLPFDFEIEVPE